MIDDVMSELEVGFSKSVEALGRELTKVRTGRASTALLDGVKVDYYGSATPISQVASVSVADARLITVKPWEKHLLPDIEKAIRSSQLGLNPSSDGEIIRVPLPPLTEERRKDLVKMVRKMGEDAKIGIRAARRDANDTLKTLLKEKEISEDEEKTALKSVQDATDGAVAKVDAILVEKEKEILEV